MQLPRVLVSIALSLQCTLLWAGQGLSPLYLIPSQNQIVFMATLHEPRKVERREEGWPEPSVGFRFKLKPVEFIRRGKLDPKTQEVEVPFSQHFMFRNGEQGPTEGMKVLAFFWVAENGTPELYGDYDGIVEIEDWKPPYVDGVRKFDALMAIEDPAERWKATKVGLEDKNRFFAGRCLDRIAASGSTFYNSGRPVNTEARALLWKLYTAPQSDWPTVVRAEDFFRQEFDVEGWGNFDTRYDVLSSAMRRVVDERQELGEYCEPALKAKCPIWFGSMDYAFMDLCRVPNRTRQTFELAQYLTAKLPPQYRRTIASRVFLLYRPHTIDPAQQKLNREVVDFVSKRLASEAECRWAKDGLLGIAKACAAYGPIPQEVATNLSGQGVPIHDSATGYLIEDWNTLQKRPLRVLPTEAPLLAQPWQAYLDKRVTVIVGQVNYTNAYGTAFIVDGDRLWMPNVPHRVRESRYPALWRVTGTLTHKFDLKRFVYRPGQPWGDGLPVTNEAEAKSSAERFVLIDSKWDVIDPAP